MKNSEAGCSKRSQRRRARKSASEGVLRQYVDARRLKRNEAYESFWHPTKKKLDAFESNTLKLSSIQRAIRRHIGLPTSKSADNCERSQFQGTESDLKVLKLSGAALLTLSLCFSYTFLFARSRVDGTYRCWRYAESFASCFSDKPFNFIADVDGIQYEGNTGNYIDASILYLGAFEKNILFFLRDAMTAAYSGRGVFIDIGANTGQHSLFMSRYATEVHAFEPWEPVLKRFRRMVENNHIKNIMIHPIGLGDQNSRKPFFKPASNNLGTGSFVEGFRSENSAEGQLEIQIGDDALAKAGVQSVALIKMDIEGYEKLALKGLRKTLRKDRPIVEFELSADPKSSVSIKSKEELFALFPNDYEFLVFRNDRAHRWSGTYALEPMGNLIRFDLAMQRDIVAYPVEKKKYIALKGSGR
jgi:FkbM family methyltransferase